MLAEVALSEPRSSEDPALSVVIPTRNRGGVIRRAVDSVLAGGHRDVEVIVVDDGSTDCTGTELSRIDDARVRVHRLKSQGSANRARNAGARLARAGLIAFLDSDDCFAPRRVGRLIRFFGQRLDVDCLVDGYIGVSRRGERVHAMPPIQPDPEQIRRMLIAHVIPLTNSAISLRRAAFEAVGGYDEDMPRHQDRELLLRLARNHRIQFGDTTDVKKYRTGQSISHDHDGYIAGMDALAARCPDYNLPENADIFRYLVVRGIIKALTTGHWGAALRELRAWRKASHLPRDYLVSIRAYRAGRAQRALLQGRA
jgi:glycosyltransferase involved in cell wall biosynthesis